MKHKIIYVILLFSLVLCSCSKQNSEIDKQTNSFDNSKVQNEYQTTGGSDIDSKQNTLSKTEVAEPAKKEIVLPTKDEVLAAREQALEGMTEDEISNLTEFIKRANLWLEHEYMYSNFFEFLENHDDPSWNYFDQTGEIQIGWAYDGDLDIEEVCKSEGLTENEFYDKYGTPVSTTNIYDAEGFASAIASLSSSVKNKDLVETLQYISDESLLAKDTHDVVHVSNIYHTLHDLDYFLLRYGIEDVGPYVTDISTISKYYDTLPCYQ